MPRLRRAAFAILLLTVLSTGAAVPARAVDTDDGIIHKALTLHPGGRGDPYTLVFPVQLTRPGEINVLLRVDDLDPDPAGAAAQPVRVVIVDARAFKDVAPGQWQQWCQELNKYNPLEYLAGDEIRAFVKGLKHLFGGDEDPPAWFHGQIACGAEGKGESIRHAVDQPELERTGGRYAVMVRNTADLTARGGLLLTFPGEHWELDREIEEQVPLKPDLTVTGLALDDQGRVVATVANRGPGAVNLVKWRQTGPDAVTLLVDAGGRSYGATLAGFDPDFALRRRDSVLHYTFANLAVTQPTPLTATIDPTDRLVESDETNNVLAVTLGAQAAPRPLSPLRTVAPVRPVRPAEIPGTAGTTGTTGEAPAPPRPDLVVSAVRLDAQQTVEIEVRNAGAAGLEAALWSAGDGAPRLNLTLGGMAWSDVALGAFDPQRRLADPGGVAIYRTGRRLTRPARVEAFIDAGEAVAESDEGNNRLAVDLAP